MAGDIAAFRAALKNAIDSTMRTDVENGAKLAIHDAVYREVYAAYSPQFYSRRGSGGIANQASMQVDYGGYTLQVKAFAPWQHLWGGRYPGVDLVDAVAEGSVGPLKYAGARPFHESAERAYAPKFERDLAAGLRARGFIVISG